MIKNIWARFVYKKKKNRFLSLFIKKYYYLFYLMIKKVLTYFYVDLNSCILNKKFCLNDLYYKP